MQRYQVIDAEPRNSSRFSDFVWGTALPDLYRGQRSLDVSDVDILEDKARTYVTQLQRDGFLKVQRIGRGPLFEHEQLVKLNGRDWIVYPLSKDPIFQRGDCPVPPEVDDLLKDMQRLEINFPAAYIAHELSAEWAQVYRATGALPAEALAPIDPQHDPAKVVRSELARLAKQGADLTERGLDRTAQGLEKAGPKLWTAGKVFGAAAMAAGALSAMALASAVAAVATDPILVGGVTLSDKDHVGEQAVFVKLAEWIYEVPALPAG
jgi:hypothetical protein